MVNKFVIAGFMLAALLPGAALAQPYDPGCVRSNEDNHAAGTILGAIGGAIVGNAIAGPHSRGAGAVLGGLGGAVAGNAIAGANDHPCPAGYIYAPPRRPGGFWAGAPGGVRGRMDFMQDRINRAADRGWIGPTEVERANRELSFIRGEESRLRDRDGGRLRPEDRGYLQSRLDSLAERLHWAEHDG
jgi:hypothetical protein